MGRMIYADHNATSPLRPEAREAMLAVYDMGAVNPSSVHTAGRAARGVVERARATLGGPLEAGQKTSFSRQAAPNPTASPCMVWWRALRANVR